MATRLDLVTPPAIALKPIEPILVGMADAATLLGISQRTLWTACKEGKVPCVKIGTRTMFCVEVLREWSRGESQQTESQRIELTPEEEAVFERVLEKIEKATGRKFDGAINQGGRVAAEEKNVS